jgi:hypothetical protein
MKTIKRIFAVVGAAVLLAGCASTNEGSGAMGNDNETGVYNRATPAVPPSSPEAPMPSGPNGSVSRGNPFGVGPGSGLDTTH